MIKNQIGGDFSDTEVLPANIETGRRVTDIQHSIMAERWSLRMPV